MSARDPLRQRRPLVLVGAPPHEHEQAGLRGAAPRAGSRARRRAPERTSCRRREKQTSNVGSNRSTCASAFWKRTFARPAARASSRATSRNGSHTSMPNTAPRGPTARASSRLVSPKPQPTSRTRSPRGDRVTAQRDLAVRAEAVDHDPAKTHELRHEHVVPHGDVLRVRRRGSRLVPGRHARTLARTRGESRCRRASAPCRCPSDGRAQGRTSTHNTYRRLLPASRKHVLIVRHRLPLASDTYGSVVYFCSSTSSGT